MPHMLEWLFLGGWWQIGASLVGNLRGKEHMNLSDYDTGLLKQVLRDCRIDIVPGKLGTYHPS